MKYEVQKTFSQTKLLYNLQNYIYRRYKDAVFTTATIAATIAAATATSSVALLLLQQ